jgi:serine/threonine protein kinase
LKIEQQKKQTKMNESSYCPIVINQVIGGGKYQMLKMLGSGYFSTVWLAQDLKDYSTHHRRVAIKICKSEQDFVDAAKDERTVLNKIQQPPTTKYDKYIIQLLDMFSIKTACGRVHVALVFELMQTNLEDLLSRQNYKPLQEIFVKNVIKQVLCGLLKLRKKRIIHTDIKTENTLVSYSGNNNYTVKIGDLGNGCPTRKHYSSNIQTRPYRAPEILLGCPYDVSCDMFSVGIMLIELLTGKCIFYPSNRLPSSVERNQHQLALMCQYLGFIPFHMIKKGKYSKFYFNRDQTFKVKPFNAYLQPHQRKTFTSYIQKYNSSLESSKELESLLGQMLHFDPTKRCTPREALKHDWFLN